MIFKPKAPKKVWQTPGGEYYKTDMEILQAPHTLIGGCTGSGKSVLINRLIIALLLKSPNAVGLILIDPKRVELSCYRFLPHTLYYADEVSTAVTALNYAISIMEERYRRMQIEGKRSFCGSDIYVIIDEYADLSITAKKQVQPLVQRLTQLGRAAKIHVIMATQSPKAKIIPTEIKINFPCKIALRVPSMQDSRNIIDIRGAEKLPKYGEYIRLIDSEYCVCKSPMITDDEINTRIAWWMRQAEPQKKKWFKK